MRVQLAQGLMKQLEATRLHMGFSAMEVLAIWLDFRQLIHVIGTRYYMWSIDLFLNKCSKFHRIWDYTIKGIKRALKLKNMNC
jgi:hypothetical protein